MGDRFAIVFLATVLIALGAAAQPDSSASPSVTILETQEAQGILGRDVRSLTDEDMGRIVDILVDGEGRVRAAIIDFGGFLGVGSRKIAVDWKALHFVPTVGQAIRRRPRAHARSGETGAGIQGGQADHRAGRLGQPRAAALTDRR